MSHLHFTGGYLVRQTGRQWWLPCSRSCLRGHFQKFSGTVEFDEANLANSKVDVQIEAASVNTKEEKREHARSGEGCQPRPFDRRPDDP